MQSLSLGETYFDLLPPFFLKIIILIITFLSIIMTMMIT